MDKDFVYYDVAKKQSSGKKVKTVQAVVDSPSVRDFGLELSSTPPTKSPNLLASIKELEQRIQELEASESVSKMKQLKHAEDKFFSMKDITGAAPSVPLRPVLEAVNQPRNAEKYDVELDVEEDCTLLPCSGKQTCKLKSGYDVRDQVPVVNTVLWPHGFLNKLRNRTNTMPDALSVESFIYGYTAILIQAFNASDQKELHGRLQHLQQIMWHAILNNWSSARSFHYQVLREIESGNCNWLDQHEMMLLSLTTAHEKSNTTGQPASANTAKSFHRVKQANVFGQTPFEASARPAEEKQGQQSQRSICCNMFNYDLNGCRFDKEGECKKLHACIVCAAKGFFNTHRALDCSK